eukprot:jgi/Bigna1/86599/estExt_fgenesh1_pg.C_120047
MAAISGPAVKLAAGRTASAAVSVSVNKENKETMNQIFGTGPNQLGLQIHRDPTLHKALLKISEKLLDHPEVLAAAQSSVRDVLSNDLQAELEKRLQRSLEVKDGKQNACRNNEKINGMLRILADTLEESKDVQQDIESVATHKALHDQDGNEEPKEKRIATTIVDEKPFSNLLPKEACNKISEITMGFLAVVRNLLKSIWRANSEGNNPVTSGTEPKKLVRTPMLIQMAVNVATLVITTNMLRRFLIPFPRSDTHQTYMVHQIREKHFAEIR